MVAGDDHSLLAAGPECGCSHFGVYCVLCPNPGVCLSAHRHETLTRKKDTGSLAQPTEPGVQIISQPALSHRSNSIALRNIHRDHTFFPIDWNHTKSKRKKEIHGLCRRRNHFSVPGLMFPLVRNRLTHFLQKKQ